MKKFIYSIIFTIIITTPASANQYLEQLQKLQSVPKKNNESNITLQKIGDTIEADTNSVYTLKGGLVDFQYDALEVVCDGDYHNHIIKQSCKSAWEEFYGLENSFYYGMSQNEFVAKAERFIEFRDDFIAKCKTNRWCK